MAFDSRISRRRLMAGAAAAALAPLGPMSVFAPSPASAASAGSRRLIPAGKVGTITYTQRDVPVRVGIAASAALGVAPTMGYLGGPDFPHDPTDLGPLVPLPGGWLELFEFAAIVGMPYMGTGNDPTSANNRNIEPWTISGEKWEALNRISRQWCIRMYTHNHSPAYHFLQDGPMVTVTQDRVTGAPIPPTQVRGESGKRLMQHYLDITHPNLVVVELDVYWAHVARHQWRWRYDWEGKRVEDIFDPAAQVARQPHRYHLFHAKDGDATGEPPGVGNGYNFIPFGDPRSDIPYRTFYKRIGARGHYNSNYEQDNAPGGTADPGQSLRFAKLSAANMKALRG